MKNLYLDSADVDEIKRVIGSNAIAGVTTNPSLMAKTSNNGANGSFDYYLEKLKEIFDVVHYGSYSRKHLSVEVITLDIDLMVDQALTIRNEFESCEHWSSSIDLHIKIPVSLDTLGVITFLEDEGVKVNATACMMSDQALLAQASGASVVSFFYNRIKDGGGDPDREIVSFLEYSVFRKVNMINANISSIICGSIRKPSDVLAAWRSGSHTVTVPMKILELMMSHPQTDKAIQGFQEDIDKWLKK